MRSLPLGLWPEDDRRSWIEACRPSVRLVRGGRARHLGRTTQDDLARRYGYFLQFLSDAGDLDRSAPAGSQIKPGAMDRFVETARAAWGSVTLAHSVYKIRRLAEILRPDLDLGWLRELEADLRFDMRPKRRPENITSEELVEAGLSLFRQADLSETLSPPKKAVLARNGLMVAVLALHPLRHKNFYELTLGRELRLVEGSWWILLEAEETKTRKYDEKRLAAYLGPFLAEYLTRYRPILLQAGISSLEAGSNEIMNELESVTGPLWVSVWGSRLSYSSVGLAITDSTEATLGIRLSPHAFRRALKTTAIHSRHPGLATAILQHTDPRVTEEFYNRSSSLSAAAELGKILRSLK
jgi:hypothetical protein